MRTVYSTPILVLAMGLSVVACGGKGGNGDDDSSPDACVGLECNVVDCAAQGKPPTTLTGTVYAPNGTLPLWGIDVYIPRQPEGPLPDTLQCDRCDDSIAGAVTQVKTDAQG